jgi:two-component system chemotaxis response regulator CheB
MPKIRVLVVDDAVVIRQILTGLLATDPEIEVIGTAANGRIALAKIPQVNPDLITLDMEMPEMDGLTTLREIRKLYPRLPVIMFSTLTERGAAATIDALSAGASDYVTKPANVGSVQTAMQRIKDQLIPKIKSLTNRATPAGLPTSKPVTAVPTALKRPSIFGSRVEVLTIGISTGGPNALSAVLPQLPADLPVPVLIVQHMPPMFTRLLAERLATQCKLKVCEASAGMRVMAGTIYIAPGDFHMTVEKRAEGVCIATNKDTPENSCRPAVDVLFRSVVKVYGSKVLGAILTGMGSDGLRGCENIHEAGGRVIVQDQATSVVWGMPGYVAQAGLAEKILPIDRLAPEMVSIICRTRVAAPLSMAS